MHTWNPLARLSLVALLLGPLAARADDAADASHARGKAKLASAKWHSPSIDGMWSLRSEPAQPLIVLAEKSIAALSKTDGKLLWKVTENIDHPTPIGSNDKVLLLQKTSQSRNGVSPDLTGLSLLDGTEIYHLPGSRGGLEQVQGNLIVVATDLATPNFGPPARPTPRPTPELTAYDLNTGKQLWQRGRDKIEFLQGLISETQYFAILDNVMTMIDATTGATQWERPLQPGWKGSGEVFRPDGTGLLLEYRDGVPNQRLLTVDLHTGKTIKNIELPGADGSLEEASGDLLVLHRPRKSSTVREFDFSRTVELTEEDKKEKITAFNVPAGKALWTLAIPQDQPTYYGLTLAGDVLLHGNPGSTWYEKPPLEQTWTLTVLDLATGNPLWKREHMAGSPVAYKDVVILPGFDFIEAVNRRTGKTTWSIPTAATPSQPLIIDGVLYFGVMANGQPTPGRPDGIYAVALDGK